MNVLSALTMASLITLTTNAATLFSYDFSSDEFYSGELHQQNGWMAQNEWLVDSDKGQLINKHYGYLRIHHPKGASDGRGFIADDKITVSVDAVLTIPTTDEAQKNLFRAGIRDRIGETTGKATPIDGFSVHYDETQNVILFSPDLNECVKTPFTRNSDKRISPNRLLTIPYADLGITAGQSSPLNIEWDIVMLKTNTWEASLRVTNLNTGKTWTYSGERILNTFPTTADALFALQKNTDSSEPLILSSISFEYEGMYSTETLGLLASF